MEKDLFELGKQMDLMTEIINDLWDYYETIAESVNQLKSSVLKHDKVLRGFRDEIIEIFPEDNEEEEEEVENELKEEVKEEAGNELIK